MIFAFHRATFALLLALGWTLLAPVRGLANPLPLENLGLDPAAKKAVVTQLNTELVADPKNYDLRIRLGALLCDLGGAGDEAASDDALILFKNFYAEQPNDPEVRAFYGSACTIHAQYVFLFFKPSWASRGFGNLDAAVAAAPENVNVRLIRALNSSQVPAFLGRDKIARADFAWLMLRRATHPDEFNPAVLRALYYYAGRYALKRGEPTCVELLAQAAAVPGDAPICHEIHSALQEARAKFPNPSSTSSHA
jgi:hypothetical protein